MIEVDSLGRSYAGLVALDGVSFRVRPGEVVGLLGPNGAGKTTCLRVLAGFVPPGQGTARVAGFDDRSRSLEVRRRVGYMPEGVPLYPEMRVDEYLGFRARLRGIPRASRRGAIDRALGRCGLTEVRRRLSGQLSRGYRQRLGLCDALLAEPPVLLLDEPTAGLDPNQTREARELIVGLAGEHTVLLSSHLLHEVEAVCSRVVILHRGRVVAEEGLATAGSGSLLLEARCPCPPGPAIEALRALPGIRAVQVLEQGELLRCRLSGESGPEVRERVAEAVHAAGLLLRELRAEAPPALEERFAELTGAKP
jgi:ABC-2 type transport system ATP-binding protein